MPAWLQQHLATIGADNPDGISRRARTTHCRKCGAHTMRGLDADQCGIPVTVDVAPIDETGEILAVLTGRNTYRLTWRLNRYELDPREAHHITTVPPNTITVLVEHHCNSAPLPIAKVTRPPRPIVTLTEKAPF